MADEQVEQKDVKEVVAESSPSTEQTGQTTPPPEESSGSEKSENRIPLPRFNEVIQERNRERDLRERYETRIRDLEYRMSSVPQKPAEDAEVNRLVEKLKMSPEAAREVVGVADAISERKTREVQAQMAQYQLGEWHRNMESKYKDYRETTLDMEKVFSRLSPNEQKLVTASPTGLEMLYQYAKSGKSVDAQRKAFEDGAKHAASVKDQKLAVSSTVGKGSKGTGSELSREAIAKMTPEEYKKRQNEINDWAAGKR